MEFITIEKVSVWRAGESTMPMLKLTYFLIPALIICLYATVPAQSRPPTSRKDTQLWNDVQFTIPLHQKVDLLLSTTLRLGRNVSHPVEERAAAAFAIKIKRYFTFTPGYLYQADQPFEGHKAYEHRLNFDGTMRFTFGSLRVSDRNLFERRLRNSQDDSTRYRNRLRLEYPLSARGIKFNIFSSDEVFYDWSVEEWVKNRFSVGVNKKLRTRCTGEIFYLRQNDGHSRPGDLHVIGTVLRVQV